MKLTNKVINENRRVVIQVEENFKILEPVYISDIIPVESLNAGALAFKFDIQDTPFPLGRVNILAGFNNCFSIFDSQEILNKVFVIYLNKLITTEIKIEIIKYPDTKELTGDFYGRFLYQ